MDNPIQPRVGCGRLLRRGSGYSGAQQIWRQRSIVVTWVPVGMWVDGGAGSPHSARTSLRPRRAIWAALGRRAAFVDESLWQRPIRARSAWRRAAPEPRLPARSGETRQTIPQERTGARSCLGLPLARHCVARKPHSDKITSAPERLPRGAVAVASKHVWGLP